MIVRHLLRSMMIAFAAASLAACTAVNKAVLATENGASRIFTGSPSSSTPTPPSPAVDLASLHWHKLSPSSQDGAAQMAVVETDATIGATRVALKLLAGEELPPYWQEAQQTYTVLNGTFVAEGINSAGETERIDQGPGTFARVPARMIQRLHAKPGAEAIMLVTVYGEWKPNFVEDTPRPTETRRAAN